MVAATPTAAAALKAAATMAGQTPGRAPFRVVSCNGNGSGFHMHVRVHQYKQTVVCVCAPCICVRDRDANPERRLLLGADNMKCVAATLADFLCAC